MWWSQDASYVAAKIPHLSYVIVVGDRVNDLEIAFERNHDNVIVGCHEEAPHPRPGVPPATSRIIGEFDVEESRVWVTVDKCEVLTGD